MKTILYLTLLLFVSAPLVVSQEPTRAQSETIVTVATPTPAASPSPSPSPSPSVTQFFIVPRFAQGVAVASGSPAAVMNFKERDSNPVDPIIIPTPPPVTTIDYTRITTFDFARHHEHSQLRIFDCQFIDVFGIDPATPVEQFFGNIFIVSENAEAARNKFDHEWVSWFWIDHSNDNLLEWTVKLSMLFNSDKIRITYDPDSGLVTSIEILTFRSHA